MTENNKKLCNLISGFPVALFHRYTLYGKDPIRQHLFFIACGLLIGYWNYGNLFEQYLNSIDMQMTHQRLPIHKDDHNNNNDFADYNILHSLTAVCGTYLILMVLDSTGLSVIATFLFNMTYLLYGKATQYQIYKFIYSRKTSRIYIFTLRHYLVFLFSIFELSSAIVDLE